MTAECASISVPVPRSQAEDSGRQRLQRDLQLSQIYAAL